MWARNVLFVGLCLVAFSALAAGLLRLDHIQDPETYRPQAHQNDADFQRTLSTLNQQLQESWQAEGIEPTPQADNLTIARRMALGLMGTVPSLEEVRALEKIPPVEQLNWYASRVFEDRRYADHVGERLARAYVGVEPGPLGYHAETHRT